MATQEITLEKSVQVAQSASASAVLRQVERDSQCRSVVHCAARANRAWIRYAVSFVCIFVRACIVCVFSEATCVIHNQVRFLSPGCFRHTGK